MRDLFKLVSFLLRLTRGIRFSRPAIAVIAIAGAAGGLASTALIAMITSIVNSARTPPWGVVWGFAALCVALPVFRFLSQVLLIDIMQGALLALRLRLTRHVLAAPLRHLENLGAPRLLATLTNDVNEVVAALGNLPTLFMHTALVTSCLAYLGWLNWHLLLQISAFIVFGVASYLLPVRAALKYAHRARALYDGLMGQIRSLVEGTKELKMHRARRRAFVREVESSIAAMQRNTRTAGVIYSAAASWGQVLFFILIGLLVLVMPRYETIPTKALISYVIILFQLMAPLEVLLNAFPILSRAAVSAQTVENLGFSLEAEITERQEVPGEALPAGAWGRLELIGVSHSYRRENAEDTFQLGPIDLTFKPGELVFIVGGNGSGKTTLAKLLLGLYKPETGEIRLAGQSVDDDNRERYREHFSAVFADYFVFEKLLGLEDDSLDADARHYLARLHLEQKVRVEDGGFSTVDLSQGQRKRLALLTAYLENRPIYLFDEWAADQDPLFKEIFYLELLPQLQARGKTVFVISHDDHYFHVADRILKLDYGKVESDRPAGEFLRASAAGAAPFRRHESRL
jgi:putative pyoverdin transport system ATP-binding/permease protein